MGKIINFDAHHTKKDGWRPVIDFVQTFFEHARDKQQSKNEEFKRIYRMYRSQRDMANRDPNKANIFIPKLYSTVETITPHYIDALLGIRPYIPIELTKAKNADIGRAMTDLLDCYLDDGNFYWEAVKLIKYTVLFGTAFIEALPDYEMRRIEIPAPIFSENPYGEQVQIGMSTVTEMRRYLKLVVRAYAPWEIYQDPFATSLDDARGVIKFRGYKSIRQLKAMAERGAFPDFDEDQLNGDISEMSKDNWGQTIAQSVGVSLPKTDDDMGIWLSYESDESDDRYIDLWNFRVVLRDIPNPYSREQGGHGKINLTKVINTDDPNPNTSWYGLGEGKPIEQLCMRLNQNWNQTFDNHDMQNEGVIVYKEDAFNVDQLLMIGGNRIPADIGPGQRVEDVFYERKTPGLSRDHYAIPEKLEQTIDETTGIHEITRGQTAMREQTAREAILKRQAGDSRIKLKVRIGEQMGLGNFGLRALHHVNQFATPDDVVEKIGVERASLLPTLNPAAIDGGYRFAFKGSQRMADAQVQRQDAKDIFQLMAGNPVVNQEWLAGWVLEKFEIPDGERRKGVRNEQQMMQMMAAQQALAGGGSDSTRAVSSGKTLGGAIGYSPSGRDQNEKLNVA